MHLGGLDTPTGPHLENIVFGDLLAWRDSRVEHAELGDWRTTIGEEVDFVIETGGSLIPFEVTATSRPRIGDAQQLRTCREEYRDQCRAGLLLMTGGAIEWIAPDVLAAPWWAEV
jgi:predicted AAA+ superfamily ATPase